MEPLAAYERSAAVYDLIYSFQDMRAMTERLRALIADEVPDARSILDVGCGTGRHLELLGAGFERVGIDLSAPMLDVARRRSPDAEFFQGDMVDFDLGRRFDVVVCLFSAVGYVRTPERLRSAVASMARHLRPGGLLLVEPWFTPEQYWVGPVTANYAENETLKVSWMYVAERAGLVSRFDIHYLVGASDGVEHFVETHEMGLFTDAEYRAAFTDAGLSVRHEPEGFMGRGLYLGTGPS